MSLPRASATLVNAQRELAFRKRRVRDDVDDSERDLLEAIWREDIRPFCLMLCGAAGNYKLHSGLEMYTRWQRTKHSAADARLDRRALLCSYRLFWFCREADRVR